MNLRESVLATIAYHDIFTYPLKIEEVATFLIENHSDLKKIKKTLDTLISEDKVGEYKGFYFLKKRKNIVKIRLSRTKHSIKKLKRAILYSKILKPLPFVHMVGISGALSMGNSHPKDDIDLVIITKANLLWTARLFTNVLLFPVKRNPGAKPSNNRACLNLFLDESDLAIKEKNIYLAHEVCQLKPLWQRNNAYTSFISANKWVKKYLPSWKAEKAKNGQILDKFSRINNLIRPVEVLAKITQLRYMKNKITVERIGETQLFFHPGNTQEYVLKEYNRRLKRLNILR